MGSFQWNYPRVISVPGAQNEFLFLPDSLFPQSIAILHQVLFNVHFEPPGHVQGRKLGRPALKPSVRSQKADDF